METQDDKQKADAYADHVARCKREAVDYIVAETAPLDEADIIEAIDLIAAGRVPHVYIDYGGAA